MLDLYKLYKQLYQRSNRNPYDEDLEEMTALAKAIAKIKYLENKYQKSTKKNQKDVLELAKNLNRMEVEYCPRVIFTSNLLEALKTNTFKVDVPHVKSHSWLNLRLSGYLYLFSAKSKPGQVKVGATTLEIERRASTYSSKFGYLVKVESYHFLDDCFKAELELARQLSEYRTSGNVWGDSNEWYSISLNKAKPIFEEFVASYKSYASD